MRKFTGKIRTPTKVEPVSAPKIVPNSVFVLENLPNDSVIARFSVINPRGVYSFSLDDDGLSDAFSISGNQLIKTTNINFAEFPFDNVLVRITDGSGNSYARTIPITILDVVGYPVANPPANTGVPQISGTPQNTRLLDTSNGTWTNAPTSYTYQWKRNGVNIAGATNANYRLVTADVGTTITCTVTATNSSGSVSATSGSTPTIIALVMDAPVLTKTSGAGVNPITFDTEIDTDTVIVTDRIRLQWDDNSGFTSPSEETKILTITDVNSQDLEFPTLLDAPMPTGANYIRVRAESPHDATIFSAWSNTISDTLGSVDNTPNNFTFTDVTNADLSTTYNSNAITVSGLGSGVSAPFTVTGSGVAVKNGIASGTSGTVVNGDTMQIRLMSSGANSSSVSGTLDINGVLDTYTVTTLAASGAALEYTSSAARAPVIKHAFASAVYNFTGMDFVVGAHAVVYTSPLSAGRTVSSILLLGAGPGGADITLVNRAVSTSGDRQEIWCCPDAQTVVTGSNITVRVTLSAVFDAMGIITGSLINASTTVVTGTALKAYSGAMGNPIITSTALTINTNGLGVAFATLAGNTPFSINTGTLIAADYIVGLGSQTTKPYGVASKTTTAGSWTPSFNAASASTNGILAVSWG
jgi:hypothetical protein